jgi:hypothetical protein
MAALSWDSSREPSAILAAQLRREENAMLRPSLHDRIDALTSALLAAQQLVNRRKQAK